MKQSCQFQTQEQVLIFNTDAVRMEAVISGDENENKYIITSMKYALVIKHGLLLRDESFSGPSRDTREM